MLRYSRILVDAVLLFTIPSFALHPASNISMATVHIHEHSHELFQSEHLLSYDDILSFIEDIENGGLEKRCSEADLDRINHFLVNLAKQGVLLGNAEDEGVLEKDIQELLMGGSNFQEFLFSLDSGKDYIVVPAVSWNRGEIVLCKSWIHKKWNQTVKFVKKHKKPILIGAAVVVAAVAVVVVCTAAVAASAGAAAAGAAAASLSEKDDGIREPKKEAEEESPPHSMQTLSPDPSASLQNMDESSILKLTLDDHISAFKEHIADEELLNASGGLQSFEDSSFGETVRNLGAILAHETLDGVSELASCVPQLLEEIKDIGLRILPDAILQVEDGFEIEPKVNYEKIIAAGHETIDQIFSTDQAEIYAPGTNAQDLRKEIVIGIIPFPGVFGEAALNVGTLTEAGKALDRAGLTKAGRALMKHGYRENSVFPKPAGNPAQINIYGQEVLEKILNHPEKQVVYKQSKSLGEIIDIHAPGIGGVRFNSSGEMIGFLEP